MLAIAFLAVTFVFFAGCFAAASAQLSSGVTKDQGQLMLDRIYSEVRDHYYDPAFHGVDLEAQYKDSTSRIKAAQSGDEINMIVARFLLMLDDSHTYFNPPSRLIHYEYGWRMQSVGEGSFVTLVKPGSDAEAKGLKAGDQILSLGGMGTQRSDLWLTEYLIYSLRPQPNVQLVVRTAGEQPRQLNIAAKLIEGHRLFNPDDLNEVNRLLIADDIERHENRDKFIEVGKATLVWKMTAFEMSKDEVDTMVEKARKFPTLIIDLRGNSGGYEETLLRLIGNLFDKDVKVGDMKRRKEVKPLIAKSRGSNAYTGKLVLLIDSDSASSAELLARVVQLEGRGTVIGDRSAGAVMRASGFVAQLGLDSTAAYSASITDADLIMKDGVSLEKVGVMPDELVTPTQADLAAHWDPVLARAAALVGLNLTPEKAGTLFPVVWKK